MSADEDDGAGGMGKATLVAVRSGGLSGAAAIGYSTSEGGAQPATEFADFTPDDGVTTFAAGEAESAPVELELLSDRLTELDETFLVRLSQPSDNLVLGDDIEATVTILDNDPAGVSIDVGDGVAVTEGADTDTYAVVLDSQPTADVTVTINGNADVTVNPSSLVFTAGDWDQPQTVTVTAVDDSQLEGEETATITTTTDSADANYAAGALTVAEVQPVVTDNDALVNFAVAEDVVSEDAGTITVEVTRTGATNQAGSVEFALSGTASDGSDYTVLTSSPVTFGAGSSSETIQIDISDDDLAEADEDLVLSLSVAAGSETVLQPGSTTQATRTITDNDVPGVSIDVGDGLSVTEGGATDSFSVVLNTRPSADVTVSIGTDADLSVDRQSLNFTPADWDSPQTVTVSAVDDAIVEPEETATLGFSVDSEDPGYAAGQIAVTDRTVTVSDNDDPSVTVDPVTIDATEGDAATTTVTIRLDAPPISDVTVTLNADAGLTLSRTTLVLNADAPSGTVELGVEDDQHVTGDRSLNVVTTLSAGEGNRYDGADADDIVVNVTEDDVAGISVAPLAISVTENGDAASFTISLDTVPDSPVTVPLSAGPELSLGASEVVLDADTLSATVSVAAVDDQVVNGTRTATVSVQAAVSDDAAYQGIDPDDVSAEIRDDDVAAIDVAPTSVTVAEAGGGAEITVTLATVPAEPVTLGLSPDAGLRLTDAAGNDIGELVLDAANPEARFTVLAVDDDVALAQRDAEVRIEPAQSADPNYAGIDPADVAVRVTDDTDTAGLVILETDGATVVSEAGLTDTYSLRLSSQPLDTVTVDLSASGGAAVDTSALSFDASNWNLPQTVTVSATENSVIDAGGFRSASIRHRVSSADAGYAALPAAELLVRVDDDDSAVRIVNSSLSSSEAGGPDGPSIVTVLVERVGSLEGNVLFSFGTVDGTAEAGLDYVAITDGEGSFANGEGGVFPIEVQLIDDKLEEGDELFFLRLNAVSNAGNGETRLMSPSEAAIRIEDDEANQSRGRSSGSLGGVSLLLLLLAAGLRRGRRNMR